MTRGTKIAIIVGGFVLVAGIVGFVGYKKGWFGKKGESGGDMSAAEIDKMNKNRAAFEKLTPEEKKKQFEALNKTRK